MDKELSFLMIIIAILAFLIVLKPGAVRTYCQYRFHNFQQKKIDIHNSLTTSQKPSTWQIETDYELAYQFVYVDCLRELGETP